jgi:perosamine synthetase
MISSPEPLPVAGPWITEREADYAAEAARTAWYANHATFNTRFETLFAETIGVKHAVSLPHCTAAIHLTLAAMGVGPGDEVIVPDVTWIASVAPVTYVGAEPVLVDILPDTWCLDPDAVEAAITPATRAIIAVDLYGSMAEWERLRAIADAHGLRLIEDSAEALGSTWRGRQAGSLGDVGVFSFHGSKTVTTGEGGMLVTDDDALFARVLTLRDHGRPPGDRFFLNTEVAFKYKMSALQAAVGLAQMERFAELIARKRDIFRWYRERLADLQGVALNVEPPGVENSAWMVTVVPDPEFGLDKFALMRAFKERNIDTRPFFTPLSQIEAFAGRPQAARFLPPSPRGHGIAARGINLPSGFNLDEDKIDLVCRALREILAQAA